MRVIYMATWSSIRNKLETDYLAHSLRGRIQYYVTTYRKSHDQEGRAVILLDGKEILQGNYFNYNLKEHLLDQHHKYNKWQIVDETTLDLGMFDQRSFYNSFAQFDNQSIENSLNSDNLLVRIFAVLDRRVGKRRLIAMLDTIEDEPSVFRLFYFIRTQAEGINSSLIY